MVVAQIYAAEEGSLFAQGGESGGFRGAGQEDGCVVSEDAS